MSESNKLPELSVTFSLEGKQIVGSLASSTNTLLEIHLPNSDARRVALGSEFELSVTGGDSDGPITFVGRPTRWCPADGGATLLVEAPYDDVVAIQLAQRPSRGSVRIPIRGSRAVRASLVGSADDAACAGAIVDVSATGMGVIVALKDDEQLVNALTDLDPETPWSMEVVLQMPGNDEAISMIVLIRYRSLERGCVKYGLHFDLEATSLSFPLQTQSINEHLKVYLAKIDQAA